ncbi:hypothetical protein NC652_023877 [Populus alba x Populus x berolinensis]|nr:hypothetical protein NC652_023877 [Populus alba x Populus x berolinensis]
MDNSVEKLQVSIEVSPLKPTVVWLLYAKTHWTLNSAACKMDWCSFADYSQGFTLWAEFENLRIFMFLDPNI